MNLTGLSIRYRATVILFILLVLLLGVWSYIALPKEASPSVQFPLITVTTVYPGAGPADVEALVTFPLEREIQGVEGVEALRSTSRDGVSILTIEFRTNVALEEASRRVREQVDLARGSLPPGAEEPRIREIDLEDLPILTINLVADADLERLTDLAESLRDELETIPGVRDAEVIGGVRREVQVNVDLTALQGYGLTLEELAATIERENVGAPAGSLELDRLRYQIRVEGRLQDPERIAGLVLRAPGGNPVYIRDVASVLPLAARERESHSRIRRLWGEDGRGRLVEQGDAVYREAISLGVRGRSGENVLELAEAVRSSLDRFDFPDGTEVVVTGDRSDVVGNFVEELENHIVFGVILVTLSLLVFLGPRTAMLAAASIPLTLLLTFAVFGAFGQTLNFIILFSLIIVLGILVDFAIIVVENIQREQERGALDWAGVTEATRKVGLPVTAGLATTAAVFVPLLFWAGVTGEFLRYIPITLILTLASAFFVALVMVPVLAGYVLIDPGKGDRRGRELPWPRRMRAAALGFVSLVILLWNPVTLLVLAIIASAGTVLYTRVLRPASTHFRQRTLPRLERRYRAALEWSLERDYSERRTLLRNAGALVALSAGIALLAVGLAIRAAIGLLPALPALVPGGLLAAAGAVGVLLHFLETLVLGGRMTMYVGFWLGALIIPFLLVVFAGGGGGLRGTGAALSLPTLLILTGAIGARLGPRSLILTDNRARVLHLALGGFLAVLLVYAVAAPGTSFFPDTDPNQILVRIEAPVGTNLAAADRTAEHAISRIEQLIERDERVGRNIRNVLVGVGIGADAGFTSAEPDPRRIEITLNLVDHPHRAESSSRTLAKLRDALEHFPGGTVQLQQDRPGPPVEPAVQIEIAGPDFDRVAGIAVEVEERLRRATQTGEVRGLVDLRNLLDRGQPEIRIAIDRERASIFGLSSAEIAGAVGTAVQGRVAGSIREGEEEYDIRVRLRPEDRATIENLEALRVAGPSEHVPLQSLARFEVGTALGSITRLDMFPVVNVEADAAPGVRSGEVMAQVREFLADFRAGLPDGYSLRYAGEVEEMQQEFGFLGIALALGIGLVAIVLVAKFNLWSVPFFILVAITLTTGGVVLGLIATRTAFSLFTFLGVISLAGIVADDDIVLCQFILDNRAEGMSEHESIVEGSVARFRQVTLTAVTTVLGLVPLTFGLNVDFAGLLTEMRPGFSLGGQNTQFWGPLGGAIIAGLPAATVVTLLVVPVIFSVFDSLGRLADRVMGIGNT